MILQMKTFVGWPNKCALEDAQLSLHSLCIKFQLWLIGVTNTRILCNKNIIKNCNHCIVLEIKLNKRTSNVNEKVCHRPTGGPSSMLCFDTLKFGLKERFGGQRQKRVDDM